jgi:hypothetical protein
VVGIHIVERKQQFFSGVQLDNGRRQFKTGFIKQYGPYILPVGIVVVPDKIALVIRFLPEQDSRTHYKAQQADGG